MNKLLVFLFLFVVSWSALAQDERYFRQLFSGELKHANDIDQSKKYSYLIHTPYYALDLNQDKVMEHIAFAKKDNEDWIEFFDKDKNKFYSYRFENKGYGSDLYRIEMKRLSKTTNILLLYYYEGVSKYINFQGTTRIYAITIDNNDFTTMSTFKGPSVFDEQRTFKGHYHKRNYEVVLEDLNSDFIKELVVKHHNQSQVFLYQGAGQWMTFSRNQ